MAITDPSDHNWYLDAGATHNMTHLANEVAGKTPYTGEDRIIVGNGSSLSISQNGYISLPLSYGSTRLLCTALHVPLLSERLLSVVQITRDHNCYFIFTGYPIKDVQTGKLLHPPRKN